MREVRRGDVKERIGEASQGGEGPGWVGVREGGRSGETRARMGIIPLR